MLCLFSNLFRLLLLGIELIYSILTKIIHSLFLFLLIMLPSVTLSLELTPTFVFYIIKCARVQFGFVLYVLIYRHQCLFGLDCWLIKLFVSLFQFLFSDRHILFVLIVNIDRMLFLVSFQLFNMFLNRSVILFVPIVTVFVKLLIVLSGEPTAFASLFIKCFECMHSVHAFFLQVFLVTLRVGFIPALF